MDGAPLFAANPKAMDPGTNSGQGVENIETNRVYTHFSDPLGATVASISLADEECAEANDALSDDIADLVAKATSKDAAVDGVRWWPLGIGTTQSGAYFGLKGEDEARKFRLLRKQTRDGKIYAAWDEVGRDEPLYLGVFDRSAGYRYEADHWVLLERVHDPLTRKMAIAQSVGPNHVYNHYEPKAKRWSWRISEPNGKLADWLLDEHTTPARRFFRSGSFQKISTDAIGGAGNWKVFFGVEGSFSLSPNAPRELVSLFTEVGEDASSSHEVHCLVLVGAAVVFCTKRI